MTALASWRDEVDGGELGRATARLRRAIDDGQQVVVAAHVAPDGDALGGALALHLALRSAGARSVPVVGEDPLVLPSSLAALPGADQVRGQTGLPPASEVDLLVSIDAASPDRIGAVREYLDVGVPTVMVDHHARGTGFGDVRVVAPGAAATVQLVAGLLDDLELPVTPPVATCLYAGLVTDTGRFGHASTDASVMEFGARLLAAGADHVELTRRLFDERSIGELQLVGHALARLTYVPDVALVHTHLTHEELDASDGELADTEGIVDLLRSAEDAEVAVVLKPAPDGTWRVSMRSTGQTDVGALATAFGGGGHAAAAGFTASGEKEQLLDDLVAWLRAR